MKRVVVISVLFLMLGACGKQDGPLDVYSRYQTTLIELYSYQDKRIDQYLSRRALSEKNKLLQDMQTFSSADRNAFDALSLKQLKNASQWADLDQMELVMEKHTARLRQVDISISGDLTQKDTVTITFVNEKGWKIDQFSRQAETSTSSMPRPISSSSETVF